MSAPDEPLECIEGPDGCSGPVAYRWPGYGERTWPRCEAHGRERVLRESAAIDRYGTPESPCPPLGFDPQTAGERWDEDWEGGF